ncbi:hypothetical protein D910_10316 [Dendroctonus ponderosae]|uniref:Uncharacterized protein n=1 Tax=Dendroctonus ponderosae TaxID=77166 RepID=U4UGB2_DENPD|nr:hypothetical protein D910_10316 [Dendroctonus ponderosae]
MRQRHTGDGREMNESRSRLGLGLSSTLDRHAQQPDTNGLDLYYNSRPPDTNWGYQPPPPVITEQPKSSQPHFPQYERGYPNTLESLAEKVHSFGMGRRMSAGGQPAPSRMTSQQSPASHYYVQHAGTGSRRMMPRSGSDQHLPHTEYTDYSSITPAGRHSLLRSSLKSGSTLSRRVYNQRFVDQAAVAAQLQSKYATGGQYGTALRRNRGSLDYSSDSEATVAARSGYYYYRDRPAAPSAPVAHATIPSLGRQGSLPASADVGTKFNSLPRDARGSTRLAMNKRFGDRGGVALLQDDADGALSAPEMPSIRRDRDEYRQWLSRTPSTSAIYEQIRASRDVLNQQRAARFTYSAENIHDALKNASFPHHQLPCDGGTTSTLDRHFSRPQQPNIPARSLSTQHITSSALSNSRSPSMRRMRQLLDLDSSRAGAAPSPVPTPSGTLPRGQRQLDINPAAPSGVRDLYCVLECDRVHKARTVVRTGDLVFDWDESFELDLVNNRELDLLIYSWDPQYRHKLCYKGSVYLPTLLKSGPIHQLALKIEPRGTLYLRLRYSDSLSLYKRRTLSSMTLSRATPLFGVDLETVVSCPGFAPPLGLNAIGWQVNREGKTGGAATGLGSGAPHHQIPIIVKRCVEEVERRGLDIIGEHFCAAIGKWAGLMRAPPPGLYRLCGSATKKRILREAFERNSRSVDLSPDNVPDINVITGVLKDYLRELPEPLFTKCLYQMMVDALGVCLPDDPEGNAKLMFSILDCLPRINRATLIFLMDHLALVVSASDRNKMNAQNLATALAPPLMLQSGESAPPTATKPHELDYQQPISVLRYLLQIWPTPKPHSDRSARQAARAAWRQSQCVSSGGGPGAGRTVSALSGSVSSSSSLSSLGPVAAARPTATGPITPDTRKLIGCWPGGAEFKGRGHRFQGQSAASKGPYRPLSPRVGAASPGQQASSASPASLKPRHVIVSSPGE